jgi:hypothetical protein
MKKLIWIWITAAVLSVFLWLQGVLLSVQQESIGLPIVIEPEAEGLVLSKDLEPEIRVILQARGMQILALNYQNIYYQIDGSKLKYGKNSLHLNPENLVCTEKQLSFITGFEDKVKLIEMDRVVTQVKPLKLTYSSQLDEEFFLEKQLDSKSAQIEITGGEKFLDTLAFLKTQPVSRRHLKNNQLRITIINPSPQTSLSKRETVITFKSRMESLKTIPLIPVIYQGDREITFSPNKVTVMLEGLDSQLGNITKDDIKVNLVLEEKGVSDFGTLEFELPPGIKILEYTPERIRIFERTD